ncbi:hypothetical protein BGZ98_009301 [Dissophora globulifera]|nr:hypothetical protein BGZ98_009301 [Dissophora globulifera]
MSFFLPNKLNPQGQRLLTIIIALPVFVSTSYILYKRFALNEGINRPVPRHEIRAAAQEDLFAQYAKDLEMDQQQQQEQQQRSSSTTSSSSSSV